MDIDVSQHSSIDTIVTYLFLKKLLTPITQTDAFRLKLVDNVGKVITIPKTEGEKKALSILDRFIFKLKRMIGSKMNQLTNFLYLQTMGNDFYNKLIVKGTIQQRAEFMRIQKDIEKIGEKYDCSLNDIFSVLLNEQIRDLEI